MFARFSPTSWVAPTTTPAEQPVRTQAKVLRSNPFATNAATASARTAIKAIDRKIVTSIWDKPVTAPSRADRIG